MKLIPLTQGQFAKVDDEDFEMLIKWKWCAVWNSYTKTFYATKGINRENSVRYMHRLIMGAKKGQQVDHIHHDTLDNRRSELRISLPSENKQNSGKQKDNTSGYKGVSWDKRDKKWRTTITKNRVQHSIGYFNTKEDAAKAYDEAAKKYHGEFAFINKIT
jgi:hypothetical protein